MNPIPQYTRAFKPNHIPPEANKHLKYLQANMETRKEDYLAFLSEWTAEWTEVYV